MHKCSVHASRSGPHNSAKYEVKLFLIYASVIGAPGHDIGEHWIDLTRLLPVSLEDLEGEKGSGKWITSFKLSGKAKGATLNVSFSFFVTRENVVESSGNMNESNFINLTEKGSSAMGYSGALHASKKNGILQHVGTVPSNRDLSKLEQSAVRTIDVDEMLKDCDTDLDEEAEHVLKAYSSSSCMQEVVVDDCVQEESNKCSKPLTVPELEPGVSFS
ncbi:hypothetical protein REPUB_Repub18cG0133600 [Reevesia pubescens]